MVNYSHSVLSLCSNYCLYAATGGVADGDVADAVNILSFALFIFSLCPFVYFFLR